MECHSPRVLFNRQFYFPTFCLTIFCILQEKLVGELRGELSKMSMASALGVSEKPEFCNLICLTSELNKCNGSWQQPLQLEKGGQDLSLCDDFGDLTSLGCSYTHLGAELLLKSVDCDNVRFLLGENPISSLFPVHLYY